jgi:hypothetical protein
LLLFSGTRLDRRAMTTWILIGLVLAAGRANDAAITVDSVTVDGQTTSSARSAPKNAQSWSVVTGRSSGTGANVLNAGFGFPGGHVSILHGVSRDLDLGGTFSLNYGVEGLVSCPRPICRSNSLLPELKVQGVARYQFFEKDKLNLGVAFAPGPLFYFETYYGTQVGFALPLTLTLGILVSSALNVGVSLDLPMWLKFGNAASFVMPILMGAGFEYFITSAFLGWFDLRMGPSIWSNGLSATFTFNGKLGVGWRF